MVLRRFRSLWRQLLRSERPKQQPALWRSRDIAAVLLLCAVVAMLSSWPWLVEPSLQASMPAPFTARAPKAARVIDSTALEDRREQMLHRTTVQVVDHQASKSLMAALEAKLLAVEQQADEGQSQVQTIALTPQERQWLTSLTPT
ncbi:MAG: HD family phosphohydrolase, partial [Cyanobium sp. LacPavin_0920_WC12_MAG_62_9]|nr:HD family phosphohydrolase [Cyanobium sp. LacPavin_0920_WC12_MAG_62_9]